MNQADVFLCENNVGVMKNSRVSGQNWSPGNEAWTTTTPSPSSMNSVSPPSKDLPTNTSLDSGVAGLRDTPVHTPSSWRVPCDNQPPKQTKSADPEIPKFIVDSTTRTTYLKGRFLGKGGFARVHELTDLTNNKTYAGKIIPKNRITKPRHKEKIAREIDLHKNLRHRHVVRFHHYFEDSSNVYIILENCSRRSLVHVIKHRIRLTEPEVRYYMRQLAEGVAYIHSQKVIHRDLKLGNMFLTEDMVMKIGDFGLATQLNDSANPTVCGTPNYIAPEVLGMQGHSHSADVWAMGCIMYTLLVGHPPFETETLKETYHRITTNQYEFTSNVTCSARSLIRKLLHPEPRCRPTVDVICNHRFFNTGFTPRSLPGAACNTIPVFNVEARTPPAQFTCENKPCNEEVKKITTSVSTMRLANNQKLDNNKISILDNGFDNMKNPTREEILKKEQTFSSCLRQKLSSVICTSDGKSKMLYSKRNSTIHKEITAGELYNIVVASLECMPDAVRSNPPTVVVSPVFISKWIDYSNKYGFGYQLSDRSVGVFFNDTSLLTSPVGRNWLEFHNTEGVLTKHEQDSIPVWLEEKYKLMQYFSTYMGEYLIDAGDMRSGTKMTSKDIVPRMRRWDRTNNSIIMRLSNGTFQVNFFKDHAKLVLSEEGNDIIVMFINCERVACTYKLTDLASQGCDEVLRERLIYAMSCLRQYADLEAEGLS